MRPLRKNAPNDPPSASDLITIAKDMVKEGKVKDAERVLAIEADLPDNAIGTHFLRAVAELAATDEKAAKKLFTPIRKRWRTHELPAALHSFVPFTAGQVKQDMAIALDYKPTDFRIEKNDNFEDEGDVFEVTLNGRQEWWVVYDNDVAVALAEARVRDDLESNNEYFNEDFLSRFRDDNALEELVRDIVMEDEYWSELAQDDPEQFWKSAKMYGIDLPDEDEDGDLPDEVDEQYIDAVKDKQADEAARDPMQYLTDMLGDQEAREFVASRVPINIREAAEAAVREDGPGAFLSSYDGQIADTVSGFCYWRVN